jgi:hypothetical protein
VHQQPAAHESVLMIFMKRLAARWPPAHPGNLGYHFVG